MAENQDTGLSCKRKGRAELPDYVEALRIASSPAPVRSAGAVARGPRGKAGYAPCSPHTRAFRSRLSGRAREHAGAERD